MLSKITLALGSALAAISLVAIPGLVIAKTRVSPNVGGNLVLPRNVDRSSLVVEPPVFSSVLLRPRDVRGDIPPENRPRTPTIPLNETSVLSSFRLGFANGDHRIKEITVLRSGAIARGVIADNNGDDNYRFTAMWWNIQGTVAGEISGTTGHILKTAPTTLPKGPPNTSLALVGFSVSIPEDREVRSLRVQVSTATRNAVISLEASDNSVVINGSYVLQYAWVPNSAIRLEKTARGGGLGAPARLASSTRSLIEQDSNYILNSFEIEFADADQSAQNLLEAGIHLGPGLNPALDREIVTWQDNDRNEAISWKVGYYVLK